MIIARTPYRISFFGGGTDYPQWYEKNGGAVLSTTIDKYCYVVCRYLPPYFKHRHHISYSKNEFVQSADDIDHPSVREVIRFVGSPHGLVVQHHGDVPALSGIGSSSAFTVGLLNSLSTLRGHPPRNKRQLALDAIYIEQKIIGENVGSQDQTAAAYGGLNKITFDKLQTINVEPVVLSKKRALALEGKLMLFFTGLARRSSEIAGEQIKNIPDRSKELRLMQSYVDEAIGILKNKNQDLDDFGKLLHESWKIKRRLSTKITNSTLDSVYGAGKRAGAIGGKLLGAGSGGFMLFYVPEERQTAVKNALSKFLHVPFKFENKGSCIIYNAPQSEFV